jgi:hypothetical protein
MLVFHPERDYIRKKEKAAHLRTSTNDESEISNAGAKVGLKHTYGKVVNENGILTGPYNIKSPKTGTVKNPIFPPPT